MTLNDRLANDYTHENFVNDQKEHFANIEKLAKEAAHLRHSIIEGQMCKRFMESDLGRFILDKAIEEEEAAKKALSVISPEEYESTDKYVYAIKDLQMRTQIPALLFTWLHSSIRAAEESDITFEQENYDG